MKEYFTTATAMSDYLEQNLETAVHAFGCNLFDPLNQPSCQLIGMRSPYVLSSGTSNTNGAGNPSVANPRIFQTVIISGSRLWVKPHATSYSDSILYNVCT